MSTGSVRPQYHYAPVTGWVNDPVGVSFRSGVAHVFAQRVPGGPAWAPGCCWAHLTSPDLVTWAEQPLALVPGDGDDGCWSGCAVPGADLVLYTSVREPTLDLGRIRAAHSDDGAWTTWRKGSVVVEPPAGSTAFRDPSVRRDGRTWRMVVGGALADGWGAVFSFRSVDLATWRYDGVLARRHVSDLEGGPSTGSLWECPHLVTIDGVDALVISVADEGGPRHVAVADGELVRGAFQARSWGQLSHGPAYYAATAFADDQGRPALLYWLRGVQDVPAGWAGALSVPHLLSRSVTGRVRSRPHPAIRGRRGATATHAGAVDRSLPSWHAELAVRSARTAPLDLRVVSDSGPTLLSVTCGRDGRWSVHGAGGPVTMPAPDHEEVDVTVLLDGCLAEIFLDGRPVAVPVTAQVGEPSPRVVLRAPDQVRLTIWDLARPVT